MGALTKPIESPISAGEPIEEPRPDGSRLPERSRPWWRRGLKTPPAERHMLAIIVLISLAAYALAARIRLLHGRP